jgi:A/G-specific adenine glycosylase
MNPIMMLKSSAKCKLTVPLPDNAWRQAFRRRLVSWYKRHARDLPWRRTRDPYAVWLSEIMLQQTQVGTVKAYFERFLSALPTIQALAAADEHEVFRLWEGLGYYRRARQLHRAAQLVVAEHGGQFPRDPQVVGRLPGIGRYTAGAILSIAFDAREPILEANTLRMLSRLLAYDGDPRSTESQRLLWAMAEAVLPRREVGRFNQALMELGSEVCTVRSPQCEACPVAVLCRANQQGRQHEIPLPKAKRAIEAVREAAVVIRRNGRILLLRWPEGRRWAGLWDFPRVALGSPHTPCADTVVGKQESVDSQNRPMSAHGVRLHCPAQDGLVEAVRALTGVTIVPGQRITTLTHGVTRFRITLECYEAKYVSGGQDRTTPAETRWVRPAELKNYALSSTGRKLAEIVSEGARDER